jgi:Ca2+-transporting ATPase
MEPESPAPYRQTSADVLAALGSDAERGLSREEAAARLARYGVNQLDSDPPRPWWRRLLAQLNDSLVILLLIATAISTGLWFYERDTPLPYEAIVIFAVVLLNAIMGYLQEARAESAVLSLRQLTAARAHVLRNGERCTIEATQLVPGDIVLVEEGDTIAADARLIEVTALQTAEAALTGESLPVAKHTEPIADDVGLGDRTNMIWSGTPVTYGRARGVVVATGMKTEMGRIAGMLRAAPSEDTALQKQLTQVGKLLGLCVIAIAVVVIGTIVWVEHLTSWAALLDALILGVALAVAAVPEGLPAVVTAVLSLGVQRMAARNAIVRHLGAVETLGAADVIASDKTGTLTKNEMTVRAVVTSSGSVTLSGIGYAPDGHAQRDGGGAIDGALKHELTRALSIAERANNAALRQQDGRWLVQGDPTEGALIVAARKLGVDPAELASRWPRIGELPFSSERKLMSTIHRDGGGVLVFSKGAADVLIERCTHALVGREPSPLTAADRARIAAQNEALAGRGLRTLGVAYRALADGAWDESVERELVFAGLIGMIDPPRDEAKLAVERARAAGIRTLMITGDHPKPAGAIAVDLGMIDEPRVVTGRELARLQGEELARTVRECSVFARVDPEHKLRIVQSLSRQGAVVAMTGDGVNDAPALKSADIGVAMGITGTDVSKEAADMVLADDNFATIVAAVEEGRAIFANIRKFLRYLLSSNIGEVMTMFFGVVLQGPLGLSHDGGGMRLPLMATQLLWINLVTDGAPALALGVDPPEPGLMDRPPRRKSENVITGSMWAGIFFVGAIMAAVTLLALGIAMHRGPKALPYAQTMTFTTLMLCQLFNVLNARSDTRSAFWHVFANGWLWASLGTSLALQIAVVHWAPLQRAFSTVSLSLEDWGVCALLASVVLWTRELSKLFTRAAGRAA